MKFFSELWVNKRVTLGTLEANRKVDKILSELIEKGCFFSKKIAVIWCRWSHNVWINNVIFYDSIFRKQQYCWIKFFFFVFFHLELIYFCMPFSSFFLKKPIFFSFAFFQTIQFRIWSLVMLVLFNCLQRQNFVVIERVFCIVWFDFF